MPINAKNESKPRELIPAGNYIARCYQMLQIGTIETEYKGTQKMLEKVRIAWELPTELKVFKEENGQQPLVISNEYTLSMADKANLRKMLASWRSKDFTEEEAKCFDITKLLGVPCMINIIHSPAKNDPSKMYETIAGVTPLPKGVECPPQINKNQVLSFDNFDDRLFDSLPDFIKDKIKSSDEYKKMVNPAENHIDEGKGWQPIEDDSDSLPF